MVLYDATIGNALHVVNTLVFAYFVVWIAVTPFVDTTHGAQNFFPPREYAIAMASAAVSLFFTVALGVTSWHLMRASPAEISEIITGRPGASLAMKHAEVVG